MLYFLRAAYYIPWHIRVIML